MACPDHWICMHNKQAHAASIKAVQSAGPGACRRWGPPKHGDEQQEQEPLDVVQNCLQRVNEWVLGRLQHPAQD